MSETNDQRIYDRCLIRVGELEAENAKLRELVREVWRSCPVSAADCRICPHYIGESDDDWCDIPMRMRELGIGADCGVATAAPTPATRVGVAHEQ